jgi:hypothetical protein
MVVLLNALVDLEEARAEAGDGDSISLKRFTRSYLDGEVVVCF